jgi:mRNA interferase MazF
MDDSPDAKDTRPCVVVSPDVMNQNLESVIIAPVSSVTRNYPTRVRFDFLGNERSIVLDQIQTVERSRLTKKIGEVEDKVRDSIVETLLEIFAH